MAKATKTEQVTIHPDNLLIQQYQAAQTAIDAFQARLNAITAAIMAQTSQPTPEALEDAKSRINAFLEGEYKSKSALRGVKLDIDLDGYKYEQADIGDVSPEMFELAQAELTGKILVDGTESPYRSIVDYVCSARDEDGAPVLLEYQQNAINRIFFPAPVAATRSRVSKPKVEGESSAPRTVSKRATWPGTQVSANISHFLDKGTYAVWGRAKSKLIEDLAAVGLTVTSAQIDTWSASVGSTLFA